VAKNPPSKRMPAAKITRRFIGSLLKNSFSCVSASLVCD
jgi:hypothetical protein